MTQFIRLAFLRSTVPSTASTKPVAAPSELSAAQLAHVGGGTPTGTWLK